MFLEPSLPRWLEPQSLWYIGRDWRHLTVLCGCPATSQSSQTGSKSVKTGFFPLLESLDHMHTQEPLANCYPLPATATSTAEKIVSCFCQLLCVCTKASAAAAQAQNGACPVSSSQWLLLWEGWSKKNVPFLLALDPQVTSSL